MWLFLAFVAVPMIEIALFIQLGGFIGLWSTLAIVVVTALVGTILMRSQGSQTILNLRNSIEQANDPAPHIAHGVMILIAGVLLLTPGFFTDSVGFLLMVPGIRLAIFHAVKSRIQVASFGMQHPGAGPMHHPDDTITTDYHEVSEERPPSDKPSGWTKH